MTKNSEEYHRLEEIKSRIEKAKAAKNVSGSSYAQDISFLLEEIESIKEELNPRIAPHISGKTRIDAERLEIIKKFCSIKDDEWYISPTEDYAGVTWGQFRQAQRSSEYGYDQRSNQ